jgi:hypothetical protein
MGLEPSTRLAKVLNKEVMFQHCHLFQSALRASIARRFEPPAARPSHTSLSTTRAAKKTAVT